MYNDIEKLVDQSPVGINISNNNFNQETSDNPAPSQYNKSLRWLVREPIFLRRGLKSGRLTEFTKGFEFVTRILWPYTLAGLLGYDIYKYYQYPDEHYGDTLEKIFLGISTNHDTWSSNLGGDLPTDYRNWLGIGLILLSPWVGGRLWSRISNYCNQWDKPFNVEDIEKLYDEDDVEAPLLLSSSIVVAFKNKSTAYLEHLILWNNKIDLEVKKIALEEIINRVNGHVLGQPAALSALANIVLYENSYKLNQYALSQRALNAIQEIAADEVRIKKVLGSTYANYLDWSLGYKSKLWRHLLFMPFHLVTSSVVWYTAGRYLEAFGMKMASAIQYLINKHNCESQGKNFRYIDPFAEYVCSLCGDWPVYLGGIDTSQDCLYGLTNQSVPIETLTSRITDRLANQYANFYDLNLNNQVPDYLYQPVSAVAALLNGIASTGVRTLDNFSFSSPTTLQVPPQDAKIELIGNFTRQVPVRNLDLSGLGMGPVNTGVIMESCANNTATDVNLARNNIQDLEPVGRYIASTNISSLDLSENAITSLSPVINPLKNSAVTRLNISRNPISESELIQFFQTLPEMPIETLELSNITLTPNIIAAMKQGMSGSRIKTLILKGTNLTDGMFNTLLPSLNNVENLDLSGNFLTCNSAPNIKKWMQQDNARRLNLSSNQFTDECRFDLGEGLCGSNLEVFIFANNPATTLVTYTEFVACLPDTPSLHTLDVSDNHYGTGLGEVFADTVVNSATNGTPIALQRFNMAGNDATDEDMNAIGSVIDLTRITHLDASRNFITDLTALANNLEHSPLTDLILDDVPIDDPGMEPLILKLDGSSIRNLSAKRTHTADGTAVTYAQNAVKPVSQSDKLGNDNLSVDERRQIHHAKPANKIVHFSLAGTNVTNPGGRALCEILSSTNTSPEGMLNGTSVTEVNVVTCQFSSSTRLQPTAFNTLFLTSMPFTPMLCLVFLVYLLYRAVAPSYQRSEDRHITFFKLPKVQPKSNDEILIHVSEKTTSEKKGNNATFFKLPKNIIQQTDQGSSLILDN